MYLAVPFYLSFTMTVISTYMSTHIDPTDPVTILEATAKKNQ